MGWTGRLSHLPASLPLRSQQRCGLRCGDGVGLRWGQDGCKWFDAMRAGVLITLCVSITAAVQWWAVDVHAFTLTPSPVSLFATPPSFVLALLPPLSSSLLLSVPFVNSKCCNNFKKNNRCVTSPARWPTFESRRSHVGGVRINPHP